ncbi:MAG: fumarylacetoacetate hydrolase family protein [Bacteroidota bacterium]
MKIICIGKNYADHALEMGGQAPKQPLIFIKPSTALLENGKPFYYPSFSDEIHYEVELVFRFGRPGKSIPTSQVMDYIDAVSVGIDFTARDLQNECKQKGHPWEIAKSFDQSAAVGTWSGISPIEALELSFHLDINGSVVQQGQAKDMIHSVPALVSYTTQRFTVEKGDLLFTGTPAGVGPIRRGDVLQGYLGEENLLITDIK